MKGTDNTDVAHRDIAAGLFKRRRFLKALGIAAGVGSMGLVVARPAHGDATCSSNHSCDSGFHCSGTFTCSAGHFQCASKV